MGLNKSPIELSKLHILWLVFKFAGVMATLHLAIYSDSIPAAIVFAAIWLRDK